MPTRMATVNKKKTGTISRWRCSNRRPHAQLGGGRVRWCSHCARIRQFLEKLNQNCHMTPWLHSKGYTPKGWKQGLKKILVHSSRIYNSRKVEATQVSIDGQAGKQCSPPTQDNVTQPWKGSAHTCYLDEPRPTMLSPISQTPQAKCRMIPPRAAKFTEATSGTGNRLGVQGFSLGRCRSSGNGWWWWQHTVNVLGVAELDS